MPAPPEQPSVMLTPTLASIHELTIDIGGIPILVRTDSANFAAMLARRYGEFASAETPLAPMELEVKLIPPGKVCDAEDVSVYRDGELWVMERGDFRAEWDAPSRRGWVRQTANPYSIDSVLRILHSLILAREGGMLVHGASAVRNGRAFVFAGVSGTGKTTLARLAPPDVTLLTDEISYIRQNSDSQVPADSEARTPNPEYRVPAFEAFGTPFAGELARIGQKVRAPLAGLFLLRQGPENRIELLSDGEAVRELLRHVLFFAQDEELVHMIFDTVCDLARRVPVQRLVFTPDARVWELIV
jgi:hypothetical protein